MERRDFVKMTAVGAVSALAGCGVRDPKLNYYVFGYQQTNYLRPPGSIEEKEFVKKCINCVACAEACPKGCIKFIPESLENAVVPHTPYIIAADNACDLCLKCTTSCPTGSIVEVTEMEKVDMGLAVIEENLCLPYIARGGCGACYTICPVNAVRLDMQRFPIVLEDKCVGCGLCEEICLVKVKAIRVLKRKPKKAVS